MREKIIVREVGLRDGLQLVKTILATETKVAWMAAEAAAGVQEFEACSFVPAHIVPQFGDAKEMIAAALALSGVHAQALTPNLKGAEFGFAAGAQQMNFVMSVSETHNLANVKRTHEQSLEDLRKIVALRNEQYPDRRIGCGLATAFGCTLEGDVPHANVLALVEKVLAIGVDEIMLPDTVGYGSPRQVRALFGAALKLTGDVPLGTHFHDTRGLGLANALAALETGIRRFDSSIAGLGGCPFAPGATGNIVTEDLVFLLEMEGFDTGIDVMALQKARDIVDAALPDEERHGNVLRAGLPKDFQRGFAPEAAE